MKPCYRFGIAVLLLIFALLTSSAQVPPKREFRGAWIATVVNLDWPSTQGGDPQAQRSQLTLILDGLKAVGINAVVFQIRPECDALYFSLIEPWSYWLTGEQGKAPVSPFDPLEFAIIESHKRGMELHAWFNPYRAERIAGSYPLAANHVAVLHPDWVIQMGTYRFLNPGMRSVRDYTASVIADVARRYDIDGAHMDDYFYQDGITTQDAATFQAEPRGFTNIGDWRRDNVNLLIRQVYDSVKAIRPNVKWGISPRGIWRPNNPPGITGSDNYNAIYCDALAWLQGQYIDYINPQLYWPFGGGQDYGKLMPWWSQQRNGRHLYVGHAPYRIHPPAPNDWSASELPNQIRLNRVNSYAQGSVFFRARLGVLDNPKGFADSLKNDLYKYPALRPIMTWKETTPPNAPVNLTITPFQTTALLTWTAPGVASDGEGASYYAVYRSTTRPIDINDARNLVSIQTGMSYSETSLPTGGITYYYAVTALDKLHNESTFSNLVAINASGVVGVEERAAVVAQFQLRQNYPNPFNPSTIISFRLASEQKVALRVYDILGREIRALADEILGPGEHQYQFDGSGLSSGVYIYRLIAGNFVESRKMQLLR